MGTDADVQVLTSKIQSVEDRLDKHDDNLKRIWERIDQQAKDVVRFQVVMEGISKTLDEVKITLAALGKDQGNKWEQFWSRAFWTILGFGVAYLTARYGR